MMVNVGHIQNKDIMNEGKPKNNNNKALQNTKQTTTCT
jgi:hypothetical protein